MVNNAALSSAFLLLLLLLLLVVEHQYVDAFAAHPLVITGRNTCMHRLYASKNSKKGFGTMSTRSGGGADKKKVTKTTAEAEP
jgi:hypothetical protein